MVKGICKHFTILIYKHKRSRIVYIDLVAISQVTNYSVNITKNILKKYVILHAIEL